MVPESGNRFRDKTMPEKRTGPQRQRRMATSRRFCFAMESGPKAAPENRRRQPLLIRPG
jgi:hypothetical protein